MDFAHTPEQQRFRDDLRRWLEASKAAGEIPRLTQASLDTYVAEGKRWQRRLHDGGWCGLHWPASYGGRGIGIVEQIIFQQELARIGSPQLVNLLALSMVGPLLIDHGTETQKRRYLRRILEASEIWCQGYSEPGAGSDLASVATRAERSGDEYVVNGQKVWTSYAQYSDFCILLARTSSIGAKHQGLTLLIVDMRSPGIEVRPLRQMNGDSEFNEVYFSDVRVPRENVVGAEGQGWNMAVALLMYERATLTFQRQLQSRVALHDLMHFAREHRGRCRASPVVAQRVAQAYIESRGVATHVASPSDPATTRRTTRTGRIDREALLERDVSAHVGDTARDRGSLRTTSRRRSARTAGRTLAPFDTCILAGGPSRRVPPRFNEQSSPSASWVCRKIAEKERDPP